MTKKTAKLPKRMQDSMLYGETAPKAVCTCGHTGDGHGTEHNGHNGHGACMNCPCIQFSWMRWRPEYLHYMEFNGHKVK